MYAVIDIGGKQYRVSEGDIIKLEGTKGEIGKEIEFKNILLLKKKEKVESGGKQVSQAKVTGEILGHEKGKKVVIFKYRRRKSCKRKQGYRQQFTKVKIKKIAG
jgi:large subunit ribosomal protein L21